MTKSLIWCCLPLLVLSVTAYAVESETAKTPDADAESVAKTTSEPKDKDKKQTAAAKTKPDAKRDVERFPAPLEFLSTNITDLEKTGHFKVERVELGRNEELGDEAFIWTVKIVKPLTCRLASQWLDQFTDVRFLDTVNDNRFELHAERLHYSSRIAQRAINAELLGEDETVQLWLTLNPPTIRMLKSRGADTVVFGRVERRMRERRTK